jgi:hypothetical protein
LISDSFTKSPIASRVEQMLAASDDFDGRLGFLGDHVQPIAAAHVQQLVARDRLLQLAVHRQHARRHHHDRKCEAERERARDAIAAI